TSRQHRPPSLRAQAVNAGYRLDGDIPWVTGADHADGLVVGAALEDGRQLVVLLPAGVPGCVIRPPPPLAPLTGARTAQLRVDGAVVPAELVLAGPGQQLVRSGGGLEPSCLALGLSGAAVAYLLQEAARRPGVQPAAEQLASTLGGLRQRLHEM